MSWGHATSTDLLHWDEQPVAIACDEKRTSFPAVSWWIDGTTPAASASGGMPRSWPSTPAPTKPASAAAGHRPSPSPSARTPARPGPSTPGNPVLDRGSADFRDPKVFWHDGAAGSYWVMVAVEAQHKVVLYGRPTCRTWEYLSTFGPANATGGVWECPDLFPLPVDGDAGQHQVGPGGQHQPRRHRRRLRGPVLRRRLRRRDVHVRNHRHRRRQADDSRMADYGWLDWGRDYYAAVSFSNAPDGRRLMIGWMNNWDYANSLPTSPWRSGMSLAREVELATVDGLPRLVQRPVLPLDCGEPAGTIHDLELHDSLVQLPAAAPGSAQLIEAEILPGTARTVAFRLLGGSGGSAATVLSFDAATSRLTLDRRNSGNTAFHGKFASAESATMKLDDGVLRLQRRRRPVLGGGLRPRRQGGPERSGLPPVREPGHRRVRGGRHGHCSETGRHGLVLMTAPHCSALVRH